MNRRAIAAATALFTAASLLSPAVASSQAVTQVSTDVIGGSLSLGIAQSSFAYDVSLNGSDQSQVQQVTLEQSDLTGTGDGWSISAVATPLETASGLVASSSWDLSLNGSPTSPTSTTGPVASDNGTGTYTLPVPVSGSYPVTPPRPEGRGF